MRSASGALITISARKSQALLAYLGARPSQRVSRDKLATLLWSSTGPDQARQSLRQTLSGLRKELSQLSSKDKLLIEEGDLLGLDETLVEVDVATFEQLVAAATEEALRQAIAIYDGDFLDGFTINEERFDQWAIAERTHSWPNCRRGAAPLMTPWRPCRNRCASIRSRKRRTVC
jgi:DNA-binding SARP family transcriptional activator